MKKLLLLLISVFILQAANSQITRGALDDEIYISGQWFVEPIYTLYDLIIRSDDNGRNISIQYYNTEIPPPPQGEMEIEKIIGGIEPGILYNNTYSELWISNDYGVNWEFIENTSF